MASREALIDKAQKLSSYFAFDVLIVRRVEPDDFPGSITSLGLGSLRWFKLQFICILTLVQCILIQVAASLNTASSDEISESLLLTDSGIFLMMLGGWFDLLCTYSCMPNVQQIIKGHNQAILRNSAQPTQDEAERACNCRKKDECPLEGNCLSKGIVYQVQVTSASKIETYVGLTAAEFKARFRNHQVSFNNETQNLASTSGGLRTKNKTSRLNGRSSQRRNLILT